MQWEYSRASSLKQIILSKKSLKQIIKFKDLIAKSIFLFSPLLYLMHNCSNHDFLIWKGEFYPSKWWL